MRKWFSLALMIFMLLPVSVKAQNVITFQTLSVSLWSEYDQPSMLVLYDFELTPDTQLPATVEIRIPKDSNITAIASVESGNLSDYKEFSGPVDDGNGLVLSLFVKKQTTYHLEYYQPLKRDGNKRSFSYQWSGKYKVNTFKLDIQVPGDSTGIQSNPTLPFVPSQQFLSGNTSLSNLEAGKAYQVDVHYSRLSENSVVTPSSPNVVSAQPITENTAGRITVKNIPYILGGVGLLLILAAIYYFWRSNSAQASTPRRKRTAAKVENIEIYCHECGTRAHADDRFCRTCGSKLRTG